MKTVKEEQYRKLVYMVESYIDLVNLLDKSPEVKALIGPMMDDCGENDPEMAFGALDMDRHDARQLLADLGEEPNE